jgi:hypothetical protein
MTYILPYYDLFFRLKASHMNKDKITCFWFVNDLSFLSITFLIAVHKFNTLFYIDQVLAMNLIISVELYDKPQIRQPRNPLNVIADNFIIRLMWSIQKSP